MTGASAPVCARATPSGCTAWSRAGPAADVELVPVIDIDHSPIEPPFELTSARGSARLESCAKVFREVPCWTGGDLRYTPRSSAPAHCVSRGTPQPAGAIRSTLSTATRSPNQPMAEPLLIACHGDIECRLLPELANRHGLITGATGTGKAVTLQTIADGFSAIGVPVFVADVKGDLTGITQTGTIGPSWRVSSMNAAFRSPCPRDARQHSGTSTASRGIRCARRSATWPAAALPHAGAERDAAGRAEPRVQGC